MAPAQVEAEIADILIIPFALMYFGRSAYTTVLHAQGGATLANQPQVDVERLAE